MPYLIYSVAYPEAMKGDPLIREFSSWIHAEAEHEGITPATYVST